MTEQKELFIEELREKKQLRAKGKPTKYKKTKDIFNGLGDRRRDPARRNGKVVSHFATTMEEIASAVDPSDPRMLAVLEKNRMEQERNAVLKRIAEAEEQHTRIIRGLVAKFKRIDNLEKARATKRRKEEIRKKRQYLESNGFQKYEKGGGKQ